MRVCMVGDGMMGRWHSAPLQADGHSLEVAVGRDPERARAFADEFGYAHSHTDLAQALAQHPVDLVVIANPSQYHMADTLLALRAGVPALVEIPLAMSLAGAQRVVAESAARSIPVGVALPMRFQPALQALRQRVAGGGEQIRQVNGRQFYRRMYNHGYSGEVRDWVDNLLWHHSNHVVDLGLWLTGAAAAAVHCAMPAPDTHWGTPMDIFIGLATGAGQLIVCTGSYYGWEQMVDLHIITDRESYRLDLRQATMSLGSGEVCALASQTEHCARVTRDFVQALAEGREPLAPARTVLPAMAALQEAQDQWDALHGVPPVRGRPDPQG